VDQEEEVVVVAAGVVVAVVEDVGKEVVVAEIYDLSHSRLM
jgi:hypothetical protein